MPFLQFLHLSFSTALQIDMNVKFEYNAITEGGQQLVAASGPGLVGLRNGGNYCYMSSVLQALAGMPALGHTYAAAAEQIMRSAPADIDGDFTAQLAKVGHALTTGTPTSAALRPRSSCREHPLPSLTLRPPTAPALTSATRSRRVCTETRPQPPRIIAACPSFDTP